MNPWVWLGAFLAMVVFDVAWVGCVRASNSGHPMRAALWALVLHGLGSSVVLAYTADPRYLTATVLGTVIGTYCAVRFTKKEVP